MRVDFTFHACYFDNLYRQGPQDQTPTANAKRLSSSNEVPRHATLPLIRYAHTGLKACATQRLNGTWSRELLECQSIRLGERHQRM